MTSGMKAAAGKKSVSAARSKAANNSGKIDVLHTLRERIAHYELPPGAKLNEYELAKEFGVPRTRIRDVFTILEGRGLIERIPNRGAMVARLEPEQVFQIYDMREVLEGLCARLACQNSDPASWQDLLDEFSGPVEAAVKNGDFESYTNSYDSFRRRCIQASNNAVLAQALDNIYEKTQVLIRRIAILPGRGQIGGLLERVGLSHAAGRRVRTYSKGMRQRLGLAQALLGQPKVLLFDEPTTGLDPASRRDFYRFLDELRESGSTILLSSHALSELEGRADRVIIVGRGVKIADGTLDELRGVARLPTRIRVRLAANGAEHAGQIVAQHDGWRPLNGRTFEIDAAPEEKVSLLRTAMHAGIDDLDVTPPTLDELYAHFQDLEREAGR